VFLLFNPPFEGLQHTFQLTKKSCLYKREVVYSIMLKNLFARLKEKREKTSNDVNSNKENQKEKDQTEV
jgi:hypothetical protein